MNDCGSSLAESSERTGALALAALLPPLTDELMAIAERLRHVADTPQEYLGGNSGARTSHDAHRYLALVRLTPEGITAMERFLDEVGPGT
jgi:hypothetical protein